MEMENNSRPRSIDRSRELKKPRLTPEDVVVAADRPPNGVRPRIPSASAAAASRGVNHQQNQPHPQQNHQELVSQYKTALAELTFNSKPIITNLTIIAGENLPVAKWIAATICSNILEVPSDQKLPSLYLLDSIVKNIGRDYIKYFASRLPEVFCKAYRQVDSSIHSGMRHLFGTWKSVFPPACLQMIEKELGIVPASNGSSSGAATSRSESQSQRPPHSIHVNPKYLEARQRLQQSNKAKGSNASTTTMIPPVEEAERPERTAAIGSERSWADLPMKHDFKNPQREASSEPVLEKTTVLYDEYEYNSDHSRNSDLGYGRASERVTERDKRDKRWYGAEKNTAETVVGQRNAFDSQHELSNYRASRPTLSSLQSTGSTQKSAGGGRGMNKSWKTSEEEEYMWDDMNSRLTDRRVDSSRKDVWTHDDAEKLELGDHLSQPRGEFDVGSRDHRESSTDSLSIPRRGTAFEHLTPSMWPLRETPTRDGLKHLGMASRISDQPEGPPTSVSGSLSSINPSLPRTGLQALTGLSAGGTPNFGSLVNTLSSTGTLGQQRHQPLRPASPSRQSSMLHPQSPSSSVFHQNPDSHNLPDEDHLHMRDSSQFGSKTSHYVPSLNRAHHTVQKSFPIIPQNPIQSGTLQNFQSQSSQSMQTSSSLMNFPQRRHQNPFSFQSLPELNSGHIQKPVPISSSVGTPPVKEHSGHATNSSADIPGQSSRSNLLASILNSGFLSNNSVSGGFPNLSHQESGALTSHSHPPFPSGLPPTHLATSSTPGGAPALTLDSVSHAGMLSLTSNPQRMSAMPPLPPGPPPPSSVVGTSQTSNVASAVTNPISGLLSSLVAKGLISTPAKESPSLLASQVPSHLQNQSPGLINHSSKPVSSYPAPSAIPKPSSRNEPPVSKSATKSIAASSSPAARKEVKDLIGIQFKPEIIRKSHPSVVGALFEDRPYQCNICGYRLELEEKLDKHLEWHASNKLKASSSGRVSRKWFMRSDDWVAGNVNSSSESAPISSVGGSAEAGEQLSLVPADESQCICLLCAEVFKDYYCQERDQWMFKDAVYLPIPGADDGSGEGPIVHVNCITPTSVADLGLTQNVKQEQVNG